MGKKITTTGKKDATHTFTAIASAVTAYARQYLWQTIKKIGANKVLYCDTDSIILRKKDIPKTGVDIHPYRLGAWSIEAEYDKLEITTCKHYIAGDKVKIKGIPSTAKKIGEKTYEYWEWCGQSTHLSRGQSAGFIRKLVTKTVSGIYNKGTVNKTGRVTPFKFPFHWWEGH